MLQIGMHMTEQIVDVLLNWQPAK